MTKRNITRPVLILLLSSAFLAGCANKGHHGNNHGNTGGHSNSGGSHGNVHGSSEGDHGTVIEDEAHSTH